MTKKRASKKPAAAAAANVTIPSTLPQLIVDFTTDLSRTFPEYSHQWEIWTRLENLGGGGFAAAGIPRGDNEITHLFDYFMSVIPNRFFDILYQNEDIFADGEGPFFLPGVDFAVLFHCVGITQTTKDAIWKYLQLILFTLTSSLNKDHFGQDTQTLFDGIDETELQTKIQETLRNINEFFANAPAAAAERTKESENASGAAAGANAEHIFEKLQKLFNGKIGSLAKTLMEEMKDELKELLPNDETTGIDFQKLMKNSQKFVNIIKKMADKLSAKINSGEINQMELMGEVTEFMKQFKDMGGADSQQFKEMFKNMTQKMGLGKNAKIDKNALARMEQKMKTRERMAAAADKKRAAAAAAAAATPQPILHTRDGVTVFSVPGEVQAKSTREEIDKIMHDLKLEEPAAGGNKKSKSKKKK
jgi:hypothetical protein